MTTKVPDSLLVSGGAGGGSGLGDMLRANNLSDLLSAATARTNLGLGTLATQSGTSSGTNTGDQVLSDATITTSDVTTNNATSLKHGFLPKLSGSATQFINGSGAWSTPAGGGDVAGPASAVSGRVATFNGTTGKIIQDSGLTLSGTNTGDQTVTLTGNVTGSGTGSFATTIAAGVVTNANLANMATKTFKGRTSAATGVPEDVPVATLKTDLVLVKADVGLGSVDNTADASKTVADSVKWNGAAKTVSTSAPSGGANGDIWFQYTP